MSNFIEAYKTLTEFIKVIISISSTLLAALVSYVVLQNLEFTWWVLISPVFLVASIIAGLMGFGRAILGIRDNASRPGATTLGNASAWLLLAGIVALSVVKINQGQDIDSMLKAVQQHTTQFHARLLPGNCKSIEIKGNTYLFRYEVDSSKYSVTYSVDDRKIIAITP